MLRLRRDTVESGKNQAVINLLKQNLIGILGLRGAGKSWLGEALLMKYYDAGFTCLDLWSAPNLENAFWIFAKEGHKKRIPISILVPDSFMVPEAKVDAFNGKYLTKEALIKFVKLPSPTKKTDSEANETILQILIDTILECRDRKRILVFNPFMFPNETEMFRILEILMRNLITISNNFFDALEPTDVGKDSEDEMTIRQLTHHKMVFLIREFGEVAPARLKGDKSGESTLIKKALLKFVRLARHSNIDGIIDYQNASDVDSSIRNQINIWMIKTWTPELAGESFEYFFRQVDAKRNMIFENRGYTNLAFQYANSYFPPIERLTQKYYYFVKRGLTPKLKTVPELKIKHKEPKEKWWKITQIPIEWDKEMLAKSGTRQQIKPSKSNEKMLYFTIKELKSLKGSRKLNMKQICEVLSEKQKNGEITYHSDLTTTKPNTLAHIFYRLKNDYENEKSLD